MRKKKLVAKQAEIKRNSFDFSRANSPNIFGGISTYVNLKQFQKRGSLESEGSKISLSVISKKHFGEYNSNDTS